MLTPAEYAHRAGRAYGAMQERFADRDGLYRAESRLHWPGVREHLWPTARAFVATLDLAGMPPELRGDFDADAAIADHLLGLAHYWDPAGPVSAYDSDLGWAPLGHTRYHDDNAWVALALIELERLRPGSGQLQRAAELFRFAQSGWDERPDVPAPGGVFWVEQGRGLGRRNHDRNTVSSAPNAELGLHLLDLGADPAAELQTDSERMCGWVHTNLRSPDGLFWDKVRGDGTIDRAQWSYNQGSMVGAEVLLARLQGGSHLDQAEQIARAALALYAGRYFEQPPAFNAIFFRNLLLLHAATGDDGLREAIRQALSDYTDEIWNNHLGPADLFRPTSGNVTLLDQSALVQVLALLAWDPANYARLA